MPLWGLVLIGVGVGFLADTLLTDGKRANSSAPKKGSEKSRDTEPAKKESAPRKSAANADIKKDKNGAENNKAKEEIKPEPEPVSDEKDTGE